MSSAIDTTVDFRRKLLRFDRPLYPDYIKPTIPRFYSSFVPSWRSYFVGPGECDSKPEHYPIEFPIRNVEWNGCIKKTNNVITPKLFNVKWIVLVIFTMVFIASTKKLTILAIMILFYSLFPSVEFFGTRPVLQRGMHFYNPSFTR